MSEQYEMLVAFPPGSDDDQFVRGFHAGMIYERMGSVAGAFSETVRTDSVETLLRCTTSRGWTVQFGDSDVEGWTYATFIPGNKFVPLRLIEQDT